MNYEITPFTPAEEELAYGEKTKEVGTAYKVEDQYFTHYYLQRENDVLHINSKGQILNCLHRGYLNSSKDFVEISILEFNDMVRQFIYNNELDKYWGQ